MDPIMDRAQAPGAQNLLCHVAASLSYGICLLAARLLSQHGLAKEASTCKSRAAALAVWCFAGTVDTASNEPTLRVN